ncbi:hypothetical protein C8J56DRAFT_464853 [Mycena floridula]|nr:hypothetical protein C8J56DRAFT_464853 [Mycena floridula]
MPEHAEVVVFEALVQKDINFAATKGIELQAHLRIFPQTFSVGTAVREYITCTADPSLYDPASEPIPDNFTLDPHDLKRALDQPFQYLLRPTTPGPLIVIARGKQLLLAAGHHLAVISFGLEASLIPMDTDLLEELLRSGEPGPNSEKRKAQALRQFRIPQRFYESHTSPNEKRAVRIPLAFTTPFKSYVVADFSRIVRFHVISRTEFWRKEELVPGTKSWALVWQHFPSGPDFVLEPTEAHNALQYARQQILETGWKPTPILSYMTSDPNKAFAGFGRHLCNDFLATVIIHPAMPVYEVFTQRWDDFLSGIFAYISKFRSAQYLQQIAVRPNSHNPFAFRERVDELYMAQHIFVFRKQYTFVDMDLYNEMVEQGLLCPTHMIGQPYQAKWFERCKKSKRQVPVIYYDSPIDGYTLISAQTPSHWVSAAVAHKPDLRTAGYSTTIGPANFHEQKQNMLNADELAQIKGKPGRKKKIVTGKPGRPLKSKTLSEMRFEANRASRVKVVASRIQQKMLPKENVNPLSTLPGRVTRSGARQNALMLEGVNK